MSKGRASFAGFTSKWAELDSKLKPWLRLYGIGAKTSAMVFVRLPFTDYRNDVDDSNERKDGLS
jgi:hypothetical protein